MSRHLVSLCISISVHGPLEGPRRAGRGRGVSDHPARGDVAGRIHRRPENDMSWTGGAEYDTSGTLADEVARSTGAVLAGRSTSARRSGVGSGDRIGESGSTCRRQERRSLRRRHGPAGSRTRSSGPDHRPDTARRPRWRRSAVPGLQRPTVALKRVHAGTSGVLTDVRFTVRGSAATADPRHGSRSAVSVALILALLHGLEVEPVLTTLPRCLTGRARRTGW
jgi:hypothetical protein